jgi:hypothetical protein
MEYINIFCGQEGKMDGSRTGVTHSHHWSLKICRGADKSLARPGKKQTTAIEDIDFHVSYL